MSEETKVQKPSLLGMIWSPTEQFERIKERPKIWGALAIISVLFIIGSWLTTLGVSADLGLEGMDEELVAGIEIITTIGIIIVGIFIPIFTVLISSFIYWVIAKITKYEVSFKQLFSMNTYILIVSALSLIVNGIVIALTKGNPEIMFTSLGSVLGTGGVFGAVFDSIEVFSIWGVILAAIGLHKVAGFSKGLAWTISIGLFVIGIIFAMVGAAIGGMAGV